MAVASGYAVLPVSASLLGITEELRSQLVGPARQASKQAGEVIRKGMSDGVDQAAKDVEKANFRIKKSAEELAVAESKLAEQKLKTEAANKAVELAARKRAEAETKGADAVAKAEQDLLKKRAAAEREARNLAKAEQGVEKALTESANAAKSLEDRQAKLDKATAESAQSTKKFGGSLREMAAEAKNSVKDLTGLGLSFDDLKGKAGLAGAALAGAASVKEFWDMGKEVSSSLGLMNRQLGLSGEEAKSMKDEVSQFMRDGIVGSAEEATEVIGAMKAQFKDLPVDQLDEFADNFSAMAQTFELDITEATQVAGGMITRGLAPDVETAADLMTAALQSVPKAMQGEMMDAMNEYGVNFANLGYTGEEMFAMLAGAAEGGQYAIDKTGDAIKEFSVLAIDEAKAEAFESLGINASDAATSVAEGGESARKTLESTAKALLEMEDPGKRAALAVELFGAPVEDLGVDQIPAFLEGLTGMGDGLGEVEGASQSLSDQMANSLDGRLKAAKGFAADLAGKGFMAIWDATQWVTNGIKELTGPVFADLGDGLNILKDLGGGIADVLFKGDFTGMPFGISDDSDFVAFLMGVRDTALDVRDTVVGAWDEVTSALTGDGEGIDFLSAILGDERAQELVDMLAEYGDMVRDFWDDISETAQDAWAVVQPVLDWLWEFLKGQLSEVLGSLWEALKDVGGAFGEVASSVGGALWDALQGAWELFKSLWDLLSPLLLPILKAIGAVVGGVLVGAFMGMIGAVRLAAEVIEVAAGVISWVAEHVLGPLIGLVGDVARFFAEVLAGAVTSAKDNFQQNMDLMVGAWNWLKDAFWIAWDWIKVNIIDAFTQSLGDLTSWASEKFAQIQGAWDGLKNAMGAAWDWIRDNVFGGLDSALTTARGWMDVFVDAFGKAFDSLKGLAVVPINFIIGDVYGGIRKAWGAVASLVDLPELPEVQKIAFKTGGIMPGYTPGQDVHRFYSPTAGFLELSGGEPVLRPEAGKVLGHDWVDGINAAAMMGGTGGVQKFLGGFASGGVIGSITNIVRERFPGMSITSTLRPGDTGHHGTGNAVDFSDGTDSTPGMRAATKYFAENYGRSLLELIHSPSPFNIKNGQSVGDGFGFYGAGTMNAHRNHVHVAAGAPLPGGGTGGVLGVLEGAVGWVGDQVKKLWDAAINAIPKFTDGAGLMADLPGAFLSKTAGAAWNWIKDKVDSIGAFFGSPGAGVEQWRPMVESVLTSKGFSTDLADTVLRRMNQESGGNPKAINLWDSNAAAGIPSKGLMQVIDPTFAAHKDPGFDDVWDPESNLRASMNYAMARYGSLPAAYNRPGGYHEGGLAGWGRGFMAKTALEPEMVLNPETTQAFLRWMDTSPESARIVAKEITEAFRGGDWGYGELADTLGSPEVAKAIVDGAAALGEISREIGPEVAAAGRGYLEAQASSLLDVVGLGGLVPMASGLADKYGPSVVSSAQSLMGGVSVTGGITPGGVTLVIEADSDEDTVKVGQLKELADRVHFLNLQVNEKRRPPAAAVTRGGVM